MEYSTKSKYRWYIAIMLFTGLMGLNILWFVPSPLLPIIMKELNINLSQGGLMMSIVCLLVAIFSIIGGILIDRIGVKKVFVVGLWFMAIGAISTFMVENYTGLVFSRVVIGIGFGLCLPGTGVIIMMWFSEYERPYMNTINSILPYVATTITFSMTVPVYMMFGKSWRISIMVWGILLILVALAWTIWGKEKDHEDCQLADEYASDENLYLSVWKNREVRLLSIAEACDMWSFQFLSSILPSYYVLEVGLDMSKASALTSIFPIAGIIAGLLCGVWMTRVGLRRPFTWPMHIMIFVGTFVAINSTGFLCILGIAMAGFGNAGWAPALFTMPMEFEDMTPSKVGAVYAIMLSMGFLAAFVSPWLGGYLSQIISIHHTIVLISFSSLIAAVCTFMMKETGPSQKR